MYLKQVNAMSEEEVKTVQIEYAKDSATITYFVGDNQVGKPVNFKPIPKHIQLFLDKFPSQDESRAQTKPKEGVEGSDDKNETQGGSDDAK